MRNLLEPSAIPTHGARGLRSSHSLQAPELLVLYRIDERLLHGQVLVGWGARLHLDYYVVVDDELAGSHWEQELYSAGAPDGVEVFFASVEEAIRCFGEFQGRSGSGALLTRGTFAMRALAEAGLLEGTRVHVGGLHYTPGRRHVLNYVFLGPEEEADLRAISERVLSVTARDLPTSPECRLSRLVDPARDA